MTEKNYLKIMQGGALITSCILLLYDKPEAASYFMLYAIYFKI